MNRNKLQYTGILFGCFILFTLLVRFVDRKAIGPKDSVVGCSAVNGMIRDGLGKSGFWLGISTFLGIIVILVVVGFACLGAYQLIRYRSFMSVDPDIYAIGAIYIIMGIFYILFEKLVVNYRPLLDDGELAASYPSSHTLMAVTVLGTAVIALHKRIKDRKIINIVIMAVFALLFFAILSRTLSGVHWITDIIGGSLLGMTLISLYSVLEEYSFVLRDNIRNKNTRKKKDLEDGEEI